jgi:hypothetical protein
MRGRAGRDARAPPAASNPTSCRTRCLRCRANNTPTRLINRTTVMKVYQLEPPCRSRHAMPTALLDADVSLHTPSAPYMHLHVTCALHILWMLCACGPCNHQTALHAARHTKTARWPFSCWNSMEFWPSQRASQRPLSVTFSLTLHTKNACKPLRASSSTRDDAHHTIPCSITVQLPTDNGRHGQREQCTDLTPYLTILI